MSREVMERGLADILRAERELRKIAEGQIRQLREVLMELAYRLAGEELEQIRKRDLQAPDNWSADDWREFFARNAREGSGWDDPDALRKRLRALERERDEGLQELDKLRRRMEEVKMQPPPDTVNGKCKPTKAAGPIVTQPAGGTSGNPGSVERMELPEIPRKPPTRFATRLSTGTRWKREALTLYLMAVKGLSLRLEILQVIGEMGGVNPGSGSLKRMIANGLTPKGLVTSDNFKMQLSRPTKASVLRLTEDGKELCRLLGWEPVEAEWERLVRLHDGDRQEEHTAGVLAFAYHSRRRGWKTEVLPPVEGKAEPDVLVVRGEERVFVEVEFGENKPSKWRNLAELQGFVALCAATEEKRSRLVAECKLDKLSGMATDIETLIKESGGVSGRLWVERW